MLVLVSVLAAADAGGAWRPLRDVHGSVFCQTWACGVRSVTRSSQGSVVTLGLRRAPGVEVEVVRDARGQVTRLQALWSPSEPRAVSVVLDLHTVAAGEATTRAAVRACQARGALGRAYCSLEGARALYGIR